MLRLVLLMLVLIASAAVCHWLAKRRGANPVFWGTLGFVFGPLAVPFALFSGPRRGD